MGLAGSGERLNPNERLKKGVFGKLSVRTLAGGEWRAAAVALATRPGECRNSLAGVAVS